jgi:DNA-binding Lrp family transcriptional regulator
MTAADAFLERDLLIIDALQVNPRASWAAVAGALGLSPLTVARRWNRLAESGLAWVEAGPGPALMRGAFLEIRCRPQGIDSTIEALTRLPEVLTVGRLLGETDLYAIVVSADHDALRQFVEEKVDRLEVERTTVTVYTKVYGGPSWRVALLDATQADLLRGPRPRRDHLDEISPLDAEIFERLSLDGRRSFSSLADELDVNADVIRRQVDRLRRSGMLHFRVDMARPLAGWSHMCLVRIRINELRLPEVARELSGRAESRFVASAVGAANLLWIVSFREAAEIHDFLAGLAKAHPGAELIDVSTILTLNKLHGRLLDRQGRAIGHVTPAFLR